MTRAPTNTAFTAPVQAGQYIALGTSSTQLIRTEAKTNEHDVCPGIYTLIYSFNHLLFAPLINQTQTMKHSSNPPPHSLPQSLESVPTFLTMVQDTPTYAHIAATPPTPTNRTIPLSPISTSVPKQPPSILIECQPTTSKPPPKKQRSHAFPFSHHLVYQHCISH